MPEGNLEMSLWCYWMDGTVVYCKRHNAALSCVGMGSVITSVQLKEWLVYELIYECSEIQINEDIAL